MFFREFSKIFKITHFRGQKKKKLKKQLSMEVFVTLSKQAWISFEKSWMIEKMSMAPLDVRQFLATVIRLKMMKNAFYFMFPVGIYLLKVNNRNARARCEICSKLTIKTPERRLVPESLF